MKKLVLVIIVFCTVANLSYAQKNAKRVLVLGLDGFSSEGYRTAKHPNIDKLFADGLVSLTTRPVMPSVTLPNWTSHFTGSGPEEHGITGNDWTLEKHPLPSLEVDADGYYPSLFKVMKEQMPESKTAYYYNWKELIYPINKKYLDEVYFEEQDKYKESYAKAFNFMKENSSKPTLVFLYSVHTDHAGHGFGWMTQEYIKSLEDADLAIGSLIDKLKAEDLYQDAHILLITDHGGVNKGHGGVSVSEMEIPWAITGPKVKKIGLTKTYNSNKNTSLVIAKILGMKNLPMAWTGIVPANILK